MGRLNDHVAVTIEDRLESQIVLSIILSGGFGGGLIGWYIPKWKRYYTR